MFGKLKIDKKLLKDFDWGLIAIVIMLSVFGCLNIYSSTRVLYGFSLVKVQVLWLILGIVMFYLILCIDYNTIKGYSSLLYWAGIVLLILNDTVLKSNVNGADSWIKLGPISFQPSEFVKIALIIMLAKKIEDMDGKIDTVKKFFTLVFYAVIPMILIVIQPDMGMTMVCFFIVLGIFFIGGLDVKVILGGFTSLFVFIVCVWNTGLIKPYWKTRLTSFLHPAENSLSSTYQLQQSLIGIGSGGTLGKGFLKGTQVLGGFVPFASSDFIFSVIGEEWGFIAEVILLLLYGILIYKIIHIAKNSKDIFGSIVCVGIVSSIMFSILQNIGMTIGVMAVSGITLPFISRGGSSMFSYFISVALVANIGMRRRKIYF